MAKELYSIEPELKELDQLYLKYKTRRTKEQIYADWKDSLTREPKISLDQFINHTRYINEQVTESRIAEAQKAPIEEFKKRQIGSIIELENTLRDAAGNLVKQAADIAEKADDEPLKERYYALAIVEKMWGKIQKEKEIAIKAHAEKRESATMFAKLARSAVSGELTMRDVEMMKNNYGNREPVRVGEPATGTA